MLSCEHPVFRKTTFVAADFPKLIITQSTRRAFAPSCGIVSWPCGGALVFVLQANSRAQDPAACCQSPMVHRKSSLAAGEQIAKPPTERA